SCSPCVRHLCRATDFPFTALFGQHGRGTSADLPARKAVEAVLEPPTLCTRMEAMAHRPRVHPSAGHSERYTGSLPALHVAATSTVSWSVGHFCLPLLGT